MTDKTTHFGFTEVPVSEKAQKVAAVFDSVADRYDVMNDVMSFGMHRLWKRYAIETSGVRRGQRVLDIAAGTGDLVMLLARRVGHDGEIIATDINGNMLATGRDRLIDHGIAGNVRYAQANAEHLPFPDDYFHHVTIAFGLRNVTDKDTALRAMFRVLKPGGCVHILEFSQIKLEALKPLYDFYSFRVLPRMGQWIAADADSYRYLAESIRMHPDQEALREMMQQAGFERCSFRNLSHGIVALHRGYKF